MYRSLSSIGFYTSEKKTVKPELQNKLALNQLATLSGWQGEELRCQAAQLRGRVFFQRIEHGQQHPHPRQQRWFGKFNPAFHQSATQTHQQLARFRRLR